MALGPLVALLGVIFALPGAGAPAALAAVGVWSQAGLAGLRVAALAVQPGDDRVLLAGAFGAGVFRSDDAGGSFGARNLRLASFIVRDLEFDPVDPSIAYAATGRGGLAGGEVAGVHRSTDGGRTWRLVAPGGLAVAVAPSDPSVVYAGGPPVRKSTNRGVDWFDPTTGAGITDIDVVALAVSPTDPNLVLAGGVTEGGSGRLYRSADGGASWQLVLTVGDGVTSIAFASASVAFFGAGTVGQEGHPSATGVAPGTLQEAGVWRSQDAGLTWQRVTADEFGELVVHHVLVNPLGGQIVYAGTTGRGVIRSFDGGERWLELTPGLGARSVLSLAIDRAAPQTLYAGTDDGVWSFTIATPTFAEPTVLLGPSRAQPGETIRVRAEGFAGHPAAGTTQCIGIRGPAQNIGFNLAPAFNLHLTTIEIGSAGQGENVATLPATLPPGPYEVVVGGCQIQRGIAPLAGPTAPLAVGAVTRYFAEGSTQPEFDTWFLLQNPNPEPATATLTLIDASGASRAFVRQLPPAARTSILADDLLPGQAISARIDADRPIFAERAMYFGLEGHVSAAQPAPARRWLLAEGSSQGSFQTWLLVQNPNPQPAQVTFTFQLQGGGTRTHAATVPPTSRFTLLANLVVPNAAFSTVVESSQPVVVERALYTGPIGAPVGGHGAPATTTPSTLWLFGEGSTQPSAPGADFQTFVLLQNPNPRPVAATIHLLRDAGSPAVVGPLVIAAGARLTFHANVGLPDEAFGIRVEAEEPIVAERAMFFGPGGVAGHDTLGAPAPATRWQLAEGSTAAPFETWILVANPNDQATDVALVFSTEDGRRIEVLRTLGAHRRATFLANLLVPNAPGLATQVTSLLPVVVERSMYFNDRRGGTNTIGIPTPG